MTIETVSFEMAKKESFLEQSSVSILMAMGKIWARKTISLKFLAGILIIISPMSASAQIDQNKYKIAVSNRDAQPLVRIPPIMPGRAELSGHCKLRFDVSPEGTTFNVVALGCTQKLFERAAIKSVQKWKYNPKIVNQLPVSQAGVESKIVFRLTDEHGQPLPEKPYFDPADCKPFAGDLLDYNDAIEKMKAGKSLVKYHDLPSTDNAKYTGQLCSNTPHGQGRAEFANGSWYEGLFEEGKISNGKGYKAPNDWDDLKETFLGSYEDKNPSGYGVQTIIYNGNKYTFKGHYDYALEDGDFISTNGDWFKGTFVSGNPQTGIGDFIFYQEIFGNELIDGRRYSGRFVNGEYVGQ